MTFLFQKNVAGILIITPNVIMFDPDMHDPSVKEHGTDKYAFIIQLNIICFEFCPIIFNLLFFEHNI